MEAIQEILFENKEKISEGIYLELMNNLKKVYDTKPNLYTCKYKVYSPKVEWNSYDNKFAILSGSSIVFEVIVDISKMTETYRDKFTNFKEPFELCNNTAIKSFPFVDHIDYNVRHSHLIKNDNTQTSLDDDEDDEDDGDSCDKMIHITSRFKCNSMVLVYSCVPFVY